MWFERCGNGVIMWSAARAQVEFDLLWKEGALDGHLSNSQYFDLFLWIGLYYLFMVVSYVSILP